MLEKKPNMTTTMITLAAAKFRSAIDAEVEDRLLRGELADDEADQGDHRHERQVTMKLESNHSVALALIEDELEGEEADAP